MQRRIRYFEMQCERHPRSRHFLALADLHRRAGDPERAVELLESGLTRCEGSISGHLLLGQSYLDLDRSAEAVEQFERVLELDADHGLAADELARCAPAPATELPPAPAPEPESGEEDPLSTDGFEDMVTADGPDVPESVEDPPLTAEADEQDETDPDDEPEASDDPARDETATAELEPLPAAADSRQAEPLPSLFVTRTLSDIYLSQGHKDKALRILYQILANHPEREDIVARISELEDGEPAGAERAPAEAPVDAREPEADNRRRFDEWVDKTRVDQTRGGD